MPNIQDSMQTIEYDGLGRMKYHPEFHQNYKKPFTEEELEYMCKYWHLDDSKTMALALGKTETATTQKMSDLKRRGLCEYYRNLNKYW